MAAVLVANGVAKADRVMVQVAKSPEAVMLYLACLRIGAIFIPLNTAYTSAEVSYFLNDATPRVVVCDPARRADIARIIGPDTHLLDLGGAGGDGPQGDRAMRGR